YLTLSELADRVSRTLGTFTHLERYRGHFLNWYDTTTLAPLPPAYVSSVDSGNLAVCLIVLAQGLVEKVNEPIPSPSTVEGLRDRLGLLREATQKGGPALADEMAKYSALLDGSPADVGAWADLLARLGELSARWAEAAPDGDSKRLAAAFARAVAARRE